LLKIRFSRLAGQAATWLTLYIGGFNKNFRNFFNYFFKMLERKFGKHLKRRLPIGSLFKKRVTPLKRFRQEARLLQ